MSGTKKFILATEKFLERAALTIDAASQVEDLDAKKMVDYLDVIYRGLQSIKLMTEDKKKRKTEVEEEESPRTLVDRMSRNQ